MTDVTEPNGDSGLTGRVEPEMIPLGQPPPPDKVRPPAALQLAAALVFLTGAILVAVILGMLVLTASTAISQLVTTGTTNASLPVEWGVLATALTGIFLILAGRGMLRLQKAWRVLALIALWLAAAAVLVLVGLECRTSWPSLSLRSHGMASLMVGAGLFAADMIMIVLLTCRSTSRAFGGSYSRAHRLVVLVGIVIVLVILEGILAVLFGRCMLAEAGVPV